MNSIRIIYVLFFSSIVLMFPLNAMCSSPLSNVFGYTALPQQDLGYLPQWLSVLERHLIEDVPEGDCTDSSYNRCHMKKWFAFLEAIKDRSKKEQISAVNTYANKKKYVLDIDNYGKSDYWAVAKEFLYNGGDCEDYAITKFFSLRWLGYDSKFLRIIVLQDENLRIPHAILAVSYNRDVLILDNQTQEVVSHRRIKHYLPLYSVNEKRWWLHLPPI